MPLRAYYRMFHERRSYKGIGPTGSRSLFGRRRIKQRRCIKDSVSNIWAGLVEAIIWKNKTYHKH